MFWFEKGLILIVCFILYYKMENMDMEMISGCFFCC